MEAFMRGVFFLCFLWLKKIRRVEFWPRRGAKGFFAGELSMALISATQHFILVEIFALLRG
ncbi:hypothetical protein OPIT5_14105 [Opitutaceae bacterium TAV5]|nr:hypothetical protein OPIT5_14105 [Opitutaceae bacterium TAV5]